MGTHLRRSEEVLRYRAYVLNARLGRAVDLILDDRAWSVEAVVVRRGHLFWRSELQIPVKQVRAISWIHSRITFDVQA